MNGPLQRLVARARGTPDPALRRIEPLLTPRYAPAAGGEAMAPELQQQVGTRPPSVAPLAPAARAVVASPRTGQRRDVEAAPEHGAAPAAPIAPTAAPRAAPPPASPVLDDARSVSAASTASMAITELRVEQRVESRVETTSAARAVPVARSDTRRDDAARAAVPRAATEPGIERETIVHDAPPSVMVSIGRIDVHAPPAPSAPTAAAPRRPTFRPSMTLDAFLRGGGERR